MVTNGILVKIEVCQVMENAWGSAWPKLLSKCYLLCNFSIERDLQKKIALLSCVSLMGKIYLKMAR